MNAQKALEIITNAIQTDNVTAEQDMALAIAQKALEKQIPKKPAFEGDGYDDGGNIIYDTWICPCCEDRYEVDYERHNHCPTCGQAIDWSDAE